MSGFFGAIGNLLSGSSTNTKKSPAECEADCKRKCAAPASETPVKVNMGNPNLPSGAVGVNMTDRSVSSSSMGGGRRRRSMKKRGKKSRSRKSRRQQ